MKKLWQKFQQASLIAKVLVVLLCVPLGYTLVSVGFITYAIVGNNLQFRHSEQKLTTEYGRIGLPLGSTYSQSYSKGTCFDNCPYLRRVYQTKGTLLDTAKSIDATLVAKGYHVSTQPDFAKPDSLSYLSYDDKPFTVTAFMLDTDGQALRNKNIQQPASNTGTTANLSLTQPVGAVQIDIEYRP